MEYKNSNMEDKDFTILNEELIIQINHAIDLEVEAIDSALAHATLSDTSRLRFETGRSILKSAQVKLCADKPLCFDEAEKYHLRYALALRIHALAGSLFDDEYFTEDYFLCFFEEMFSLLDAYGVLLE